MIDFKNASFANLKAVYNSNYTQLIAPTFA